MRYKKKVRAGGHILSIIHIFFGLILGVIWVITGIPKLWNGSIYLYVAGVAIYIFVEMLTKEE